MNRMDNAATWDLDRTSIAKAVASAMIGRPSQELIERITASGQRFTLSCNIVSPQGQQGGLPVLHKSRIEGGCGVSGTRSLEQDEECARAGIAAINSLKSNRPVE